MTVNAFFLADNAADIASVVASSELATAPAINVQDSQRSAIWRSSGVGSASHLDFTLQNATPINFAALVDVNLTKDGSIHVEAWDDALGGATKTVDITLAPAVFIDPLAPDSFYGSGNYGVGPFGTYSDYTALNARNVTLVQLVAQVTSKFWRFTFTDANTNYQQCGRVVLAKATQFVVNLGYNWQSQFQERSIFRESLGGQRYSQPREPRGVLAGNFDFLTDTERTTSFLVLRRYGERKPLVFSIFPDNTDQGKSTTLYGHFSSASLKQALMNINSFPFQFIEDL